MTKAMTTRPWESAVEILEGFFAKFAIEILEGSFAGPFPWNEVAPHSNIIGPSWEEGLHY
jgi:hypothetical protein